MTNKNTTFNLADLDMRSEANDAQPLTLTHPHTGETLLSDGKPMVIWLLGAHSDAFRAAINARARADMAKRTKPLPSIELEEQRSAQALAAATTKWENITWTGEDGKPALLPYSKENAAMLFEQRGWIREQADAFVADAKNFWSGTKSKY